MTQFQSELRPFRLQFFSIIMLDFFFSIGGGARSKKEKIGFIRGPIRWNLALQQWRNIKSKHRAARFQKQDFPRYG